VNFLNGQRWRLSFLILLSMGASLAAIFWFDAVTRKYASRLEAEADSAFEHQQLPSLIPITAREIVLGHRESGAMVLTFRFEVTDTSWLSDLDRMPSGHSSLPPTILSDSDWEFGLSTESQAFCYEWPQITEARDGWQGMSLFVLVKAEIGRAWFWLPSVQMRCSSSTLR
jgi:hypothetical protein